ncbi:MAG TPA: NADH-quinone oxidoreductase subunit NuoF [Candidatus Acidoferrum sp.]|nr:NADH-quinone oxidoreductase subunit NuoF [Candidatus Acidoferrum sp.]
MANFRAHVLLCTGTGCTSSGSYAARDALLQELKKAGLESEIRIVETGCMGRCDLGPVALVHPDGTFYRGVVAADVPKLVSEHFVKGRPYEKLLPRDPVTNSVAATQQDFAFFNLQSRVVRANCGIINPENIEEYIARDGYAALGKVLNEWTPARVIEEIKASGLRGRGGAGFPTGVKWELMAKVPTKPKYVICNADEGDPGAFMNRSVIEADPHSVVEGMIIGAYAMGANRGFIYIRAEYPLAIKRLQIAIDQGYKLGVLGKNIFEKGFDFDIELRIGAGAFVCGEETALMHSIEGKRGQPMPRPPFPAQSGLWGKPTNINNVETWSTVPIIIRRGGPWYATLGTEKTKGTKVFALAGKIQNTGLAEVPFGTPLRDIIFEIGGGPPNGKQFKAVQTGGPSGGVVPASLLDTPLEYEALQKLGSIMGSGGLVVMDEDSCMVDVARFFLEFCCDESCGKCPPCRVGTKQMLNLLEKICRGEAVLEDLDRLEAMCHVVRDASLCGLGQTAPNPVLTTLKHFRQEYEEHIREHRCAAGVCTALQLSPCENTCPLHMNIPVFLQLLKEDRLDDAFEQVVMDNPLPASTGRVCQHSCENRCRRAGADAAVNMRETHRYIADMAYNSDLAKKVLKRILKRKQPATGRKIAVVGAGPAGLSAAFYLALLGHRVTVYDSAPNAGGMLRYALPEYRLPKHVVDKEVAFIRATGVQFKFNATLGKTLKFKDLERQHDAVLLAMGTWQETLLGIPGEEARGLYPSLEFLNAAAYGQKPPLGRKVVIIGGGNSAIDAARTSLRMGAEVTIVYRRSREDMPAIPEETRQGLEEGARLITMAAPLRVILDKNRRITGLEVAKTVLGKFDARGRRSPVVTKETYIIPCDTIIKAIGEKADSVVTQALGLETTSRNMLKVNPWTHQTSHPKVFAAGDYVTGAANVSIAMGWGKKAAKSIDRTLTGEDRFEKLWPQFVYSQTIPPAGQGGGRNPERLLPVAERRGTWVDVSPTFTEWQAKAECFRCLRCDIKAPEATTH